MDDTNDGFRTGGLCGTCIFTLVLHSYMVMDAISAAGKFTRSTPEAVRNVRDLDKFAHEGVRDGPFHQGCVLLDGWDRPCRFRVRPGRH